MAAELLHGDCADLLAVFYPDDHFDAVVTDAPYGLSKEPEASEVLRHWLAGDDYEHRGGGFMGKAWDSFVPGPRCWAEVLRVLKPGGHALVFAGSRTQDLMTLSLRLAGFEIRDVMMWLYGTGFPKSMDLGKRRADRAGWGTALKPAYEPVILARKPVLGTTSRNVEVHGTGGLNIDDCRIPFADSADETESKKKNQHADLQSGARHNAVYGADNAPRRDYDAPGRWPANLLHDGLAEPWARYFYCAKASRDDRDAGCEHLAPQQQDASRKTGAPGGDNPRNRGGAKRANHHPTVKPTELMRYLCRLITPPGGLVLDPFMGSGSTGKAAALEGFDFVGIEREAEYCAIAKARIESARQAQTPVKKTL